MDCPHTCLTARAWGHARVRAVRCICAGSPQGELKRPRRRPDARASGGPEPVSGRCRSPGPARRAGTTPRRSAGPRCRTARPDSCGVASSAARVPPASCVADDRLRRRVRAGRPVGQAQRELVRRGGESLVGQHAVDHVPPLEGGCAEQLAAEDQFAGPRRPGALGQPLRTAHRRRQADDDLDQPEAGRLGRQQQVAGQRDLERRGQAQRVRREHRRERQRLELVDHREPVAPQRLAGHRVERLEQRDVHPARHRAPVGPDQQAARAGRRRDRVDRRAQRARPSRRRRGSAAGRRG